MTKLQTTWATLLTIAVVLLAIPTLLELLRAWSR